MKRFIKIVGFLSLCVTAFAGGFSWRDIVQLQPPSAEKWSQLVVQKETVSPTELFKRHYNYIFSHYYKAVDKDQLRYAAMEGLFASLGDPHTQYMQPEDSKEFDVSTQGEFVGIGARLAPDPLGARIASVFKDGPAFKAGLIADDLITGVDGKDMTGKDVEDIVKNVRGESNTVVRLLIVRAGEPKPITLPVLRARVTVPTAEAQMLPGTDIGYILISQFAEITPMQFDQALDEVDSHTPKGLVIDLRGNPGGMLESATEMLSRFVSDKTVVKMKMRDDKWEEDKTPRGQTRTFKYPIVILMNEESASAAEIFAGVLRDYKKATLVGEHSYGKASVQKVFKLPDMSSAKITIAKYYLPGGEYIGRNVDADGQFLNGGLKPDFLVPFDEDAALAPTNPPKKTPILGDPERDNQLRKAIEVIREKHGQALLSPNPLHVPRTHAVLMTSDYVA